MKNNDVRRFKQWTLKCVANSHVVLLSIVRKEEEEEKKKKKVNSSHAVASV